MIALDPLPRPLDHLPMRRAPRDVALVDRAGTMTFADLEAAVGVTAARLSALGLVSGDRVATWLPKTRLACVMPLATVRAGLVHVPINPLLRRAQVAHILADSGARLLVTQPSRATTLEAGDVPDGCAVVEDSSFPREGGGPGATNVNACNPGPPPSRGERGGLLRRTRTPIPSPRSSTPPVRPAGPRG